MGKFYIYGGITVGGAIGSYVPVLLFRANPLGGWSILLGVVGSFIGLWAGYKTYQNFGE